MVVALPVLIAGIHVVLVNFTINLPLFVNVNIVLSWWKSRTRDRKRVQFQDLRVVLKRKQNIISEKSVLARC